MALILEIATSNEWHVLKGETQHGPYTYEDMIKMLQSKAIFEFDYVWSPHMDHWSPLAELPEFSSDRILRLVEKSVDSDSFEKRKTERIICNIETYVHDNKKMWVGKAINLSEGGALVQIDNPLLLPGDNIVIHFKKSHDKTSCFNARAVILTKRFSKQKIVHDTSLQYAVKFTEVNNFGMKQIKDFIQITKGANK